MERKLKNFLEAGRIVSLHGVNGEVRVQPWCDSPELLKGVKELYFDCGGEKKVAAKWRPQNNMALCKLEGCDTPEQARALVGRTLWARRSDIPIAEGTNFIDDLIGLDVVDETTGETVGTLAGVIPGAASDIYEVKLPGGEVRLVPAVEEFVKKIDVPKGIMVIRPIKGLLSDEV